jgi:hypothetical protein
MLFLYVMCATELAKFLHHTVDVSLHGHRKCTLKVQLMSRMSWPRPRKSVPSVEAICSSRRLQAFPLRCGGMDSF